GHEHRLGPAPSPRAARLAQAARPPRGREHQAAGGAVGGQPRDGFPRPAARARHGLSRRPRPASRPGPAPRRRESPGPKAVARMPPATKNAGGAGVFIEANPGSRAAASQWLATLTEASALARAIDSPLSRFRASNSS